MPHRLAQKLILSLTVIVLVIAAVAGLINVRNQERQLLNSMILGAHILNYTVQAEARGLILHTSIAVGYGVPWRTVHQLLIRAAEGTDGILTAPEPFVLQTSLNDFHITYEINAFTNRPSEMEGIVAKMHERIQDEFNRAGVEILSPAYLSLRDGNTVTPKQNRTEDTKEPWFTLPRP